MSKRDEEGQDWQQACRVCGKVKCPKAAKVGEWMRGAVEEAHRFLAMMAGERPEDDGWRTQTARFDSVLDAMLCTYSHYLECVCVDCQETTYPADEEKHGDGDGANFEAWKRWAFAVPPRQDTTLWKAARDEVLADVESTGTVGAGIAATLRPPPTITIQTAKGPKDVECAFFRGGLAVTLTGEADLAKARAEVEAGVKDAYPAQAWAVTHVASGFKVCGTYDNAHQAVAAARRLLPLQDWTLPSELLKPTPEAQEAVRLENFRCDPFGEES